MNRIAAARAPRCPPRSGVRYVEDIFHVGVWGIGAQTLVAEIKAVSGIHPVSRAIRLEQTSRYRSSLRVETTHRIRRNQPRRREDFSPPRADFTLASLRGGVSSERGTSGPYVSITIGRRGRHVLMSPVYPLRI